MEHPGQPTDKQKGEILDSWIARHGDARNAHKPGLTWGGVQVKTLPATMRDAQGPEIGSAIVADVARMFRIYPPDLLHLTLATAVTEAAAAWADTFARFTLFPRIRRIERAFSSDPDLFPGHDRYMRFDAGDFTRANISALANVGHKLRQVGALTANEVRAMMGLPRIEGGDELLATPVGAGANESEPEPAAEPDEEQGE